ncbi:hypothetical protein RJT34_33236 [Clitoria ternatea]|uniref:Uncharacterized protein n=1 Tax=Clitoria ternatea TaxID=43366 RepID=A0AAN9I5B6_CLITE
MASVSYRRLRNEEEEVKRAKAWLKLRALAGRRRPRLCVAGLRKFFLRKRTKFVSRFRVSWLKAFKKFKNGKTHINDLFGGNFLLMQANLSTPFQCAHKPSIAALSAT